MIPLSDFAKRLRGHDWSACMSDSYEVTLRARRRFAELKSFAGESKNHARLFELACAHEQRFTWCAEKGKPARGATREEVNEAAWRWVGAYLWVHGVRLSDDEAKALVGAADSHSDWYGKEVSTARRIDWDAAKALLTAAA